jgi:GT2 family glycosyltransferase
MGRRSFVGIVTVTFNSGAVLRAFIESVLKQSHAEFLLYVVDNASADGTLKVLAEYHDKRIVVIPNQTNVGVARGNNQGIRSALDANCDDVLLINNDTEFDADLLKELLDGLDRYHSDVAVPKITHYDNPDTLWYAGGYFNHWKGYRGMHCGLGENDRGEFDEVRQVQYAPTCCMLVRSEVFESIGVMDEQYFVYVDDTDFCFRAMRRGIKIIYLPSARVLHKVSSLTGNEDSKFALRYMTRGHVYFIRKNFGFWTSACYLTAYQVRLFYKLLSRGIDWDTLLIRQGAFFEGWGLPVPKNPDGTRIGTGAGALPARPAVHGDDR